MDLLPHDIQAKFLEIFCKEPLVIRAPGRINLIGEHTDYNDGFVMPAAIDKEIFFAIHSSGDGRSMLHSINYGERHEIDMNDLRPVKEPHWANFLLGVLFQFKERGYRIAPFNCVFGGNIPLGAGMSSSAAMECGFACALNEFNLLKVPPLELITMAQWAEHHYVGVQCGIMDQFASMMGKEGHVIVLDCRSLEHRYAPLNLRDCSVILCDTKVKHSLVDSEYNNRRRECEQGVKLLQRYHAEIRSLRDVTEQMLEKHRAEFEGNVYKRCLYVVQEIRRVQDASVDLDNGDIVAFGKKMYETHQGLSELYEVSCAELDFLVEEARKSDRVVGSRMMGGGFGGCTINLVRNDYVEAFIKEMTSGYKIKFAIDMATYRVNIVDGTGRVDETELARWT
jgi:galactokinase